MAKLKVDGKWYKLLDSKHVEVDGRRIRIYPKLPRSTEYTFDPRFSKTKKYSKQVKGWEKKIPMYKNTKTGRLHRCTADY